MEKLNIAEILKYSDRGGRLYSPLCGECILIGINTVNGEMSICVATKNHGRYEFNEFGQYYDIANSECLLFPSKENRDWNTFNRPFKDGDVVTDIEGEIIIYKGITTPGFCGSFVSLDRYNQLIPHYESYLTDCIRFATEEEKQKLFKAIKDNGYRWNAETKTLEELV